MALQKRFVLWHQKEIQADGMYNGGSVMVPVGTYDSLAEAVARHEEWHNSRHISFLITTAWVAENHVGEWIR